MKNNDLFPELWRACNQLRGKFDPSEYKYVILTIIFLKFASDVYKIKTLEYGNDEVDTEDLKGENYIIISKGYSWDDIVKKAKHDDIHIFMDEVLSNIEANNSGLKNSLWKKFAEKFTRGKSKLTGIIEKFSNIDFGKTIEEHRDILGAAYEYFLMLFGEASGKKAGEFYTPKSIVELMVGILAPQEVNSDFIQLYDPTVGSGGMFVQSAELVKKNSDKKDIYFVGQEINEQTYTLAKMNLSIRGLSYSLGDEPEDTLVNDQHSQKKFDIVIANPPFNLQINKADFKKDDRRWKYGMPSESKGNYYFMQHMIDKLNSNGRMAVLLDNGSTTANSNKKIRENILKDDLYEAIIQLPGNIFFGTSIPATLFILNKKKDNKNKVLFMDCTNNCIKQGKVNILQQKHINKVIKIYKDFKKGKAINIKNFAIVVSNKMILENDSNLSIRQYIESDIKEINYQEEYKAAIADIESTIKDLRNEFSDILKLIEKNKNY